MEYLHCHPFCAPLSFRHPLQAFPAGKHNKFFRSKFVCASVADPDPFDTNPDLNPAFHFDIDPDPDSTFKFDLGPDPTV